MQLCLAISKAAGTLYSPIFSSAAKVFRNAREKGRLILRRDNLVPWGSRPGSTDGVC